jgi:predicted RNA-binding protein YlxR (DUF448 family)
VGCGRIAPKAVLQRVALAGDVAVADPSASLPGRGAYVCDAACAEQALQRRALGRAFRRTVTVPHNFVESIG